MTNDNAGDRGIAEAERRFGSASPGGWLPARGTPERDAGAAGIAEAERRFGTERQD